MTEKSAIEQTEQIMNRLGIPFRDTWNGWGNHNLDDYYTNGGYGGPVQFCIELDANVKYCQVAANKRYSVPDYKHLAYDGYRIQVPSRMQDRADVIIHETAHFLQVITSEEESNYVDYDGSNYEQYISQRTELEAHVVQLCYMSDSLGTVLPEDIVSNIFSRDQSKWIQGIINAKCLGLI